MRDPVHALDFDCALALRARHEIRDHVRDVMQGDGGFFAAVLALLSE